MNQSSEARPGLRQRRRALLWEASDSVVSRSLIYLKTQPAARWLRDVDQSSLGRRSAMLRLIAVGGFVLSVATSDRYDARTASSAERHDDASCDGLRPQVGRWSTVYAWHGGACAIDAPRPPNRRGVHYERGPASRNHRRALAAAEPKNSCAWPMSAPNARYGLDWTCEKSENCPNTRLSPLHWTDQEGRQCAAARSMTAGRADRLDKQKTFVRTF